MINKLKRKPIIIGVIVLVVIALAAAFTVPAFAFGKMSANAAFAPDRNITMVKGTVSNINSSQIVIDTAETPNQVTLALDSNTNFSMHGVDWLTPNALAGKPVTAIYKNDQTATPPVASQIIIDMPDKAGTLPKLQPVQSIAKVDGTLSVSDDGSVTIGDISGIKLDGKTTLTLYGLTSLKESSGKTATAVYNGDTRVAVQVSVNMPAGPAANKPMMPFPPRPFSKNDGTTEIQSFTRLLGTLTVNDDGSIKITPANGTETSLVLDSETVLTLYGFTSLADASGKTATAVYDNSQSGTLVALMVGVNMPREELPMMKGFGPMPFRGGQVGPGCQPGSAPNMQRGL
jgi:hypothetical protein